VGCEGVQAHGRRAWSAFCAASSSQGLRLIIASLMMVRMTKDGKGSGVLKGNLSFSIDLATVLDIAAEELNFDTNC